MFVSLSKIVAVAIVLSPAVAQYRPLGSPLYPAPLAPIPGAPDDPIIMQQNTNRRLEEMQRQLDEQRRQIEQTQQRQRLQTCDPYNPITCR